MVYLLNSRNIDLPAILLLERFKVQPQKCCAALRVPQLTVTPPGWAGEPSAGVPPEIDLDSDPGAC